MSEKLTMTVDIRAQLNQFNSAMNTAKEVLNKTFSGKGIKTYTDEMNKIGRIFDKISRTTAGPIDSKATFMQMQKEVMDATQRIEGLRDSISNLRNLTLTQRLSFLPDNFSQNLTKGKNAIEGYYDTIKKINGTKVSDENYQKITKSLEEAEKKLEKINKLQETLAINQRAAAEATAKTEVANKEIEEARILKEQITSLKQKNELRAKYNDLVKNSGLDEETIKTLRNARSSNTIQTTLSKVFSQEEVALINKEHDDESKTEGQKKSIKRADAKRANRDAKNAAEGAKAQANVPAGLSKEKLDEIVKAFGDYDDALQRFKRSGGIESELKKETTTVDELDGKIRDLTQQTEVYDTTLKQTDTAIANNLSALARTGTTAEALENQIADLTQKKEELDTKFDAENELKLQEAYKKLSETLKAYGIDISECGDITQMSAKEFKALFSNLYDNEVVMQEIDRITPELAGQIDILGDRAEEAATQIYKESDAFDKLSERSENIDRLTARVKQFTGFVGVINLARKAMRDALQTVKDLDKAMTDMAVVTKSTVSDYWEQLPEYTKRANKLGATIRDMYEADTLYYQQGLKTNQVMQVSNETMKMARIAGLGAAEATDRMTNALRGFNMAINEESAQRINDVYSKLAAITASNVDEISTAMTKTASIAHSAGMEFETTAAFLSQIIETTRESAETAGTALKTVIARFEELKKAPSEIGEIDGEIIDANKIEGALRTVGVALRDSEGQFRKLDDVFMELAGKWSSLDKNTQRYIATIAAGSRQQSRFIALMQDYSHTVELVDAAYTSAGTSQQQYEKTLESMETILKRLQNSWNTFTMGLFNSNLLKGAASTATELLNLLNKVLDTLDITNLGLGKIVITAMGINKLGTAFKVFTNELKQTTGTIGSSFAAVGGSIKEHFTQAIEKTVVFQTALANQKSAIVQAKQADDSLTAARAAETKATEAATRAQVEYNTAKTKSDGLSKKSRKSTREKAGQATQDAEARLNNREIESKVATQQRIEAQKRQIEANNALTESNVALAHSMGLNNEQAKTFNELMLVSNTQTESSVEIARLGVIASNQSATAKYKELLATKELSAAEAQEQVIAEFGLNLKRRFIAISILEYAQRSKLLKVLTLGMSARIADIGITKIQNATNITLAKTIGIVTASSVAMAAVMAGIAAAIYVIVRVVKELSSLKLSNRIKETQERLNECNEAISDCKDALKGLQDEQDRYKSLHEELEQNVQGTEEWKKKLLEVNEQVYDLIQKYPVLASYVQRSTSGELTISDGGWSAVQSQTQDKLQNARIAQYTTQRKLYNLQEQEQAKQLAKMYQKEVDSRSTSYLFENGQVTRNRMANMQIEADINPEFTSALGKYQNAIEQNTAALGVLNDNIIQRDTIEEQNIVNKVLDVALKDTEGSAEEIKKASSSWLFGDIKNNKQFLEWAKLYGLSEKDFSGRNYKDLAKLYAASQGTEVTAEMEKRARLHNDPAGMYAEIAENVANKRAINDIDKLTKNLNETQVKALNAAFNTGELRVTDLAEIKDMLDRGGPIAETLRETLNDLGFENYSEFFTAQVKAAEEGMQQAVKDGIEEIALKGISLDQVKQVAQLYERQYAASGRLADYSSLLNTKDGKKIFEEFFNFDLTSIEGLEEARDALIKKWPKFTSQINQLIDETRDFGHVLHSLDFDKVKEKIETLAKYLDGLEHQTQGNKFSEEAYKELIDKGAAKKEDFIRTADGSYVYKNSMEQLTQAIKENTLATIDDTEARLGNKLSLAEKYQASGMANTPYYSSSLQNAMMDNFIKENSSLLSSLGIGGIDSYEAYSRAGDELKTEVQKAIKELIDYTINDYETQLDELENERNMAEAEVGSAASIYANDLNQFRETGDINSFDSSKIKMSNEEYQRYTDILERIGKGSKEAEEEYTKFMEKLSNKQTIRTAEDNMKNYMGTVKTFVDEYENLGDETLKYNKTLELANTYGIRDITEDNYQYYAGLFDQFSQGNMDAYENLLSLILGAHGYALEDANQLFTQASNEWSEEATRLAQILQNLGLAYEQSMGDGTTRLRKWSNLGFAVPQASGGGSKDEWEDPYNWLWNINKRINKEIFERERLERAYQKAVEDATKSEQDLYDVSKKELANLERQAILERDKGQKAMQEAKMMMQQRPEFGNYVSWNATTGQIQVDYNKIDSENWGSARGEAFEEFVSRLEELNDEVQDSQTTLEEIEDLTEDIKNRGRDQYIELQDRIKSALVEINQREIDTAQKINDSIKTAQESLLNKIQEEISETRQIRANQEKEQELEDKRQRLNYLRRDTTGANAVQIRQLEEELRKGEQSYTDSLTDQTIQNIQKANQKAEEQRTEQIEIMNNQLTRWQETGAIWDTVNTSINEGFNNPDSFLNSNVASLIASAENRRALSEIQQADWDKELENQAKLAELFNNGELYQQGEQTLEAVQACQTDLNQTMVNTGTISWVDQKMYDYLTNVYPKNYADKIDGIASGVGKLAGTLDNFAKELFGSNSIFDIVTKSISETFEDLTNVFKKNQKEEESTPTIPAYKVPGRSRGSGSVTHYTVNDSGGLNTYTGFAWLDGTPTKPEYVLNADQTKAFFNLVNTLTSNDSAKGMGGDNYFDIDINVDELASDYDVTQLASKIKEEILEDANYRNVNLVSFLR